MNDVESHDIKIFTRVFVGVCPRKSLEFSLLNQILGPQFVTSVHWCTVIGYWNQWFTFSNLVDCKKMPCTTIEISAIKLIRMIKLFKVKLFSEYDVTNLYLVTACSFQPLIHVHSCTHTSTFIFHLSNHKNISTRFHSAHNQDNKIRAFPHVCSFCSQSVSTLSRYCLMKSKPTLGFRLCL